MISGFDFNKLDFVEMKYIMQLYADETAKESFTKILEGIFGAKLKMFLEDFDKDSISFEIYNYDDNNHTIDKVLKLSNFDCEIFNMRTFQGSGFEKVVITPDDDKLLLFEVKKAFRKFMLDLYKDDPDYAEILKSHMEDEMNDIRLIYDYDCDNWAKEYDKPLAEILERDREKFIKVCQMDRDGRPKPRKDIYCLSMMKDKFAYFLNRPADIQIDEEDREKANELLEAYQKTFALAQSNEEWFNEVKELAGKLGYATDNKLYKANPENFKGNVAKACEFIRLVITGEKDSPTLFTIMEILGEAEVKERLGFRF